MESRLELTHGDLPGGDAPVLTRLAAKALIVRDGRLLVLRSRLGDLKLPGGGVDPGESPQEAGPEWVAPREMLASNRAFLVAADPQRVRETVWWVPRAVAVLERLLEDGVL